MNNETTMRLAAMAQRLRDARGKRSTARIAERAGITEDALAAYENGLRCPRDEVKLRLAQALHCSIGFLFFNENDTKCDDFEAEQRCPWCGAAAEVFYRRGNETVGCECCTDAVEAAAWHADVLQAERG